MSTTNTDRASAAASGHATVPVTEVERLLNFLGACYWSQVSRLACERHARTLGLFDRGDDPCCEAWNEGWSAGLARGMWYLLAEVLAHAPLPPVERGRRLLWVEDDTPPADRVLNIDPDAGAGLGLNPAAAEVFRAMLAHDRAIEVLLDTGLRTEINWRFVKQLLGLDPSRSRPDDPTDHWPPEPPVEPASLD